MSVRGIGIDLVPISRMRQVMERWQERFVTRVFTAAEIAYCRSRKDPAPHFAARDFMLTFGYYAPGADDLARVQFFDDFEGYAWSFPRTDHLSLGICGKAGKCKAAELRDRLGGFMKQFGYAQSKRAAEGLSVFSHLLPALSHESWHNLRLTGPGWALVGDAAGLVDPVTGEGIYFAMRSGELLAESLLAGTPEAYPERVWQDFGRKLALGASLGHFFYHEDFLGQPPTTRFIQLAARSTGFMNLLQSFIDGSQSYSGLTARLYKTVGQALVEIATASIRNQLSPARAVERRKNSGEAWPREHEERAEQGAPHLCARTETLQPPAYGRNALTRLWPQNLNNSSNAPDL